METGTKELGTFVTERLAAHDLTSLVTDAQRELAMRMSAALVPGFAVRTVNPRTGAFETTYDYLQYGWSTFVTAISSTW